MRAVVVIAEVDENHFVGLVSSIRACGIQCIAWVQTFGPRRFNQSIPGTGRNAVSQPVSKSSVLVGHLSCAMSDLPFQSATLHIACIQTRVTLQGYSHKPIDVTLQASAAAISSTYVALQGWRWFASFQWHQSLCLTAHSIRVMLRD